MKITPGYLTKNVTKKESSIITLQEISMVLRRSGGVEDYTGKFKAIREAIRIYCLNKRIDPTRNNEQIIMCLLLDCESLLRIINIIYKSSQNSQN